MRVENKNTKKKRQTKIAQKYTLLEFGATQELLNLIRWEKILKMCRERKKFSEPLNVLSTIDFEQFWFRIFFVSKRFQTGWEFCLTDFRTNVETLFFICSNRWCFLAIIALSLSLHSSLLKSVFALGSTAYSLLRWAYKCVIIHCVQMLARLLLACDGDSRVTALDFAS